MSVLPNMQPHRKRLLFVASSVVALGLSFICGAIFLHKFYVYRDPIARIETHISPGDLYTIEDFVRANSAVESFLANQSGYTSSRNLRPYFIAAPTSSGYVVYYSSGRLGTEFPPDLLETATQRFKNSLGEIRTRTQQIETQEAEPLR